MTTVQSRAAVDSQGIIHLVGVGGGVHRQPQTRWSKVSPGGDPQYSKEMPADKHSSRVQRQAQAQLSFRDPTITRAAIQ